MDQQPEQQAQAEQPPVAELPPVPAVPETDAQSTEMASEPMGRPQDGDSEEWLEWQASEYIEHEKSLKWFVILGVVTLALVAAAVFLLKNYTFAILLVVMAIAIAVWAKRPASNIYYRLNTTGVWVDEKFFSLHDFRSFGVLQDGAVYAVMLLPNKRFSPGVTVYLPHEMGEEIVDILGTTLTIETIQPDWIDRLTRKLNF